ncbi:tol-pal system protein YbgF [Hwanghaeella grinnelliae]|uniref:Cell division coordinator CpoB n=1 Tax=Hwanghaeella grinnelliae TaxID=2500179 RepID=A0A3S2Z5V5_9PROT|nr:tol-pal system protein YbgF [Hwanghaeella grinnelliae]RVU33784.1 tol-pal system protein YbgF [Hwanghaeella grinnelliae]
MFIKAVSSVTRSILRTTCNLAVAVALAVAISGGVVLTAVTPAFAQDSSISQQLQRLRRDITDLQRTVFTGATPPADAVAAAQAPSAESAQATARLQLRIQALEREIRTLTGRIEETGFQLNSISNRLDKLVSDVDFRLQALERGTPVQGQVGAVQQPGAVPSSAAQQSAPVGTIAQSGTQTGTTVITSQGSVSNQPAQAAGGVQPGAQVLGQVSQTQLQQSQAGGTVTPSASQPQVAATQPAAPPPAPPAAAPGPAPVNSAAPQTANRATLPPGSEKEQYQYAYGLLRQDLEQAEGAFKAFLDEHPEGPFAGNAMYWLGETHYARSNFRDAAAVFVDAYTNFPKSPKASASLLKLGMSLGQLGKKDAACASFAELKTKYPNSDSRVLERADAEAGKVGCP